MATRGVSAKGGKVEITIVWKGKRYRPTLDITPTKANLAYAAKKRLEILAEIDRGEFNPSAHFPDSRAFKTTTPDVMTVQEFGKKWLGSADIAHSTRYKYEQIAKWWWERIGDKPINKVLPIDITSEVTKWSPKTRNHYLSLIRQVLRAAYQNRLREEDISGLLRNAKVQQDPPEPFTQEEVTKILCMLQKKYAETARCWFQVAFFTGLRPSEQAALNWSDLDWQNRTISVRRAMVYGKIKELKTHSARDVEALSQAWDALREMQAHTRLKGELIFPFHVKRPEQHMREVYWRPTIKALKLRYREPYHTRHTFATHCLMSGCNPDWVRRQLGHKNLKMLLEVYSKWIDRADKNREREKAEMGLRRAENE